jgi:hypothetical protein
VAKKKDVVGDGMRKEGPIFIQFLFGAEEVCLFLHRFGSNPNVKLVWLPVIQTTNFELGWKNYIPIIYKCFRTKTGLPNITFSYYTP